ncbi:MAG: sulfatase-like hydrolase/transferase [Myxococcota bacterium]
MTIDTLRADRVGSYGANDAHTRTLDTVAREGVRFEAAISPTPLTLPSHASLMTALEPPAHQVRHNGIFRLGEDRPTLAERFRSAGYATAAFVGSVVLDRRFGLARGFDHYDDEMAGRVSSRVGFAERPAVQVVAAAERWLEAAPDRFFLWVHFYDPHADYAPPPGFASAFASRPYEGEIAYVDAELGRLLAAVESHWPAGRTMLAVTSDHGESLGEHGEATHSYTLYDATQRVPLLLRGPGLPPGRVVGEVVRLADVGPTLLALARAEAFPDADGIDLRPVIDGAAAARPAYVESVATHLDYGWSPLFGVRTAAFKYIRAPRPELYDLRSDPAELRNVAAEHPREVARLEGLLAAQIARRADVPGGSVADLDDLLRRRLRSLGYVAPERAAAAIDWSTAAGPDPKDEIGLLALLSAAQKEADSGRVSLALERLRRIENSGTAVAALRAALAVDAGDYRLAESDAREVLSGQPRRADLWLLLGRALAGQGRLDEADTALRSAIALDGDLPAAHLLRGRIRERSGQPDPAERSYRRALAAAPGEPRLRLAALLRPRGAGEEAEALLEAARRRHPRDPRLVRPLDGAAAGSGASAAPR